MNVSLLVPSDGDLTKCTRLCFSKDVKAPKGLLEAVQRMERKNFPSTEVMDFKLELRKANTSMLCVSNDPGGDPAVVAYLLYAQLKGVALLHKICVRPDHRRRGLGSGMIKALLEHLRSRNCTAVQLWVDEAREPARCLYAAHGFRQADRVEDYYGPGRTGLRMLLDLDRSRADGP